MRDLYRKNHRLYLRYAVVNHTGAGYLPIRPVAWFLEGVRAQQSLIPLESASSGKNSREASKPMPKRRWELWTPTKLRWSLRVVRAGDG